ncbi:MAG: MBL fold metallo-hydrolase [Acidobacteria bacterium]|nr:MBL fold metallo-hydrolase [Acidobacteriota bacterium]
MQIGRWDVQVVSGGTFALDGGAMFGTVPKTVWSKIYPPDEENRIPMGTNCLLIRGEVGGRRHVILVETGNGDKEDPDWRNRFALGPPGALDAALARHGVRTEEITLCILTHLHFDHAGGSTRLGPEGRPVPAFPNARHLVQRRDLEDGRRPHLRVRASYLARNWEPLEAAGLLETVEGPSEVLPGIRLWPAPGHIAGLQGLTVEDGGRKLLFPSDLVPTARHIQPAWCMGYDLDVVTCVNERLKFLAEVADRDAVCVFYHDPHIPAGTVHSGDRGRYLVRPLEI